MHHRKWSDDEIQNIREWLRYDPETGGFYWRLSTKGGGGAISKGNRVKGTSYSGSYVKIGVRGKTYPAHHLAYLFMTGEQVPEGLEIDHRDINPANNRWSNLRAVTRSENVRNSSEPLSERITRQWLDPAYREAREDAFARPEVIERRSKAIKAAMTPEVVAKSQTPEAKQKRQQSLKASWADQDLRDAQSENLTKYLSDPVALEKRVEQVKKEQEKATEAAAKVVRDSEWYTDGSKSRRLNAGDLVPDGWYKGRAKGVKFGPKPGSKRNPIWAKPGPKPKRKE